MFYRSVPQINGTEQRVKKWIHTYGQLIFGKGAEATQWRMESLLTKDSE